MCRFPGPSLVPDCGRRSDYGQDLACTAALLGALWGPAAPLGSDIGVVYGYEDATPPAAAARKAHSRK